MVAILCMTAFDSVQWLLRCWVLHVCHSAYNGCAAGKYMYNFNTCTDCPAGKDTQGKKGCTGRGGAACFDCAKGKYAASAATGSCTACAKGKYQDKVAATGCTLCPKGRYRPEGTGLFYSVNHCLSCPVGR